MQGNKGTPASSLYLKTVTLPYAYILDHRPFSICNVKSWWNLAARFPACSQPVACQRRHTLSTAGLGYPIARAYSGWHLHSNLLSERNVNFKDSKKYYI